MTGASEIAPVNQGEAKYKIVDLEAQPIQLLFSSFAKVGKRLLTARFHHLLQLTKQTGQVFQLVMRIQSAWIR